MIHIINGPNLNLLGVREPEIYGTERFEDYFRSLTSIFLDVPLVYKQSNIEGEIVNFIHEARGRADGIVINAAAYSHTSVAIADALKAVGIPTVEVHISNIFARESYRHHSLVSASSIAVLSGMGLHGYRYAIEFLLQEKKHNR